MQNGEDNDKFATCQCVAFAHHAKAARLYDCLESAVPLMLHTHFPYFAQ